MKKHILLALFFALGVPAPASATTYCTAGDSIMSGARPLRLLLEDANPDRIFVGAEYDGRFFHDGVGGDTSRHLVERLDTIPPCDVALVLIGTNDLNYLMTIDATISRIQRIINTLRARGTQVYVLTILPRFDSLEHNLWNTWINKRILSDIVDANKIDAYKEMMVYREVFAYVYYDGIHLTPFGYQLLFGVINPMIP